MFLSSNLGDPLFYVTRPLNREDAYACIRKEKPDTLLLTLADVE